MDREKLLKAAANVKWWAKYLSASEFGRFMMEHDVRMAEINREVVDRKLGIDLKRICVQCGTEYIGQTVVDLLKVQAEHVQVLKILLEKGLLVQIPNTKLLRVTMKVVKMGLAAEK